MHSLILLFTNAKLFVEAFALPLAFVAVGIGMIVILRLARAAHAASIKDTAAASPKQKRFQLQFGIGFFF